MALSKAEILDAISQMTVLELSGLIKDMEEKFGVSAAAAAVAVAAPAGGGGGAADNGANGTLRIGGNGYSSGGGARDGSSGTAGTAWEVKRDVSCSA